MIHNINKIVFFLLLNLSSFSILSAQGSAVSDSLQQVYEKSEDPVEKIRILERLFTATLYNDPAAALVYPIKALKLAKENDFISGVVTSYFNMGVYHQMINNLDSTEYYYQKAMQVLKQTDIPHLFVVVNSALADHEARKGNYAEAIRLYEISDSISFSIKHYLNAGIGKGAIGSIYEEMGYYTLALKNNLEGLAILDTISEEPYRKADIYRAIGNIHSKQGQYAKALQYKEDALLIYKQTEDHVFEAWTYLDKGNIYTDMEDYQQAIIYYERAVEEAEKYNVQEIILDAQSNLGGVYNQLGDYDTGLFYLSLSLETYRNNTNEKSDYIRVLVSLAKSYAGKNNIAKAWSFAEEATTLANEIGSLELMKIVYQLRSSLNEKEKKYGKALTDFKYAQTYKDSLLNEQKNRELSELHVVYETEQKEQRLEFQKQEIINLEQEVEITRLSRFLLILGLIAVSILAGLVYLVFRHRLRQKQQEYEQQQKLLQQDIAFKKKELLSQTVHLVEKNTFLQQLSDKIESAIRAPERLKGEAERVLLYLRREQAEDQTWETFKSYFTEIHDDFNKKLRKQSKEDITEKEVRLAAFLRMNLATKEIAALLNVLPDSVLKSKYRLKKKLALSKEQDLQQFLGRI